MIWLLGSCLAANPQKDSTTLTIKTPPGSKALVGAHFEFPLTGTGGSLPYTWQIVDGHLPAGLKLHPHTGMISGVPTATGEYRFAVSLTDSSAPHQIVKREVIITVTSGVSIDWKDYPAVLGNAVSGSVTVTNDAGHPLDVTVIVVAVNEIGRATALGYQHFTIPAQTTSQVIPFGSSPGLGKYLVRADAIAHRPGKEYIYRASQQTSDPLQISQH